VALPARADNQLPADAETILDKASELELYSLDPKERDKKPKDGFHGWKVLGKTTLKKKEDREKVVKAIRKGIADSDGSVAGCFNPRHGLKAKAGGKTVELVICYECHSLEVYVDGKRSVVLTARSGQPGLDKVLQAAGVKLPKKAG
jgi:hypothetical protein